MKLSTRIYSATASLGLLLVLLAPAALATPTIVNIDAKLYGLEGPTAPQPVVGQVISPETDSPNTPLNQQSFPAGTYTVTNATGEDGANPDFTAWNYNENESNSWTWEFVIADASTNKVIMEGFPGIYGETQNDVAGESAIKNFSSQFTLAATTTLDFMIDDFGGSDLSDNEDGVAIDIECTAGACAEPTGSATSVPEPSGIGLFAFGLLGLAWFARKRNVGKAGGAHRGR